jgi:hypothetical protein
MRSRRLCWQHTRHGCYVRAHQRHVSLGKLHRSFGVAKCVVKDVACVLRLGRVYVLKVLLASDLSPLVRVWIEDLLCWLQSLPDAAAEQLLPAIAAVVEATRVSKRDLGFAALQQPE